MLDQGDDDLRSANPASAAHFSNHFIFECRQMIKIIGVHPVEARQPCHLVEFEFGSPDEGFDWGSVTQEDRNQPTDNWQVAYDEAPLNDDRTRWAFFFHYLDTSNPLLTPAGSLELPAPTPLPDRLKHLRYEEP